MEKCKHQLSEAKWGQRSISFPDPREKNHVFQNNAAEEQARKTDIQVAQSNSRQRKESVSQTQKMGVS